ncbi:hypothetical protein FM076_05890 [Streptomyces albus subsp. chlorinus]|uniref:phospholipase A2 n=1 Tax=Streptomyces albus TaxID=1888 RepID=UPI00156D7CAA|nr:phospholipase A2 [Streptomyces albus]NSC20757.1 hypothetical protein [Streptomyces albus subsp. chlorinus]
MRRKFPSTLAAGVLAVSGLLGTGLVAPAGAVAAGHAPAVSAPAPATVPVVSADPAPLAPDPKVRAEADRIMNLTYRQFAKTPHVAPFNWNTDGCSVPAGFPYRDIFRPACVQHDFGYRNYGARHQLKLSPTRETKNWIDGRFRTEMRRLCADTYTAPRALRNCRDAAQTYYLGVQVGGDSSFF